MPSLGDPFACAGQPESAVNAALSSEAGADPAGQSARVTCLLGNSRTPVNYAF